MSQTIHGKIHGKTIQLDQDAGLADGEEVEVIVKLAKSRLPWGEGIKRSAGAMATHWTEEDDRILAEIQEDRVRASQREILE